jgi:drug/metabolite transporter (DMT)-like permease
MRNAFFMQQISRYRLALALMLFTPALWTVNYLVARSAPGVIEPHALALLRWLIASALFSLGHWHEIWEARAEIAREWKRYLVLGALGMWICGAWVYIGGRTTAAINISLIYSVSPVLIVLAAAFWLKERISLTQGLGVALALAGVLHVVLKGEWAALGDVKLVPGDGWIVGATVAWAAYSLLLRRWPSALNASARLSVIAMAGVLVILPFAVFEVTSGAQPALTMKGAGLVLAVAAFPGYGAYLAYSVMQRELGVARVGVVLYLGPIYAAVIAWLVIGEALHGYHAWAMAMVLPGIYLVNRKRDA